MRFFWKPAGKNPNPSSATRARPSVEELESRLVPYAVSGNAWIHPELVTLSFIPDGTLMTSGTGGTNYSNLFSKFNARWSTATWEDAIITGAQTWAQYANLNFAVVSDNGTSSGLGSYQQGDPGMGDIRVGGYTLSNSNYLALGYMPPPINNYSIAGDISLNTSRNFNIGSTYDLETVTMHEVGHTLGLNHSTSSAAVMYATYHGTLSDLTTDDINGIQAIYGVRSQDLYDTLASNDDFATAASLTALIDPVTKTAQVSNLDLTTATDQDFYTFVAPIGSSSNLTVSVKSAGLSLFRPSVTVYAADQTTVLGSATADSTVYNGATLNVTVGGVSAGQQFYVQVTGADFTAFDIGRYALTLNLGTGPLPNVPLPNTLTLNGTPLSGGGGIGDERHLETLEALGYTDGYSITDEGEHGHAEHPGNDSASLLVAAAVPDSPGTAFRTVSVVAVLSGPAGAGSQGMTDSRDAGGQGTQVALALSRANIAVQARDVFFATPPATNLTNALAVPSGSQDSQAGQPQAAPTLPFAGLRGLSSESAEVAIPDTQQEENELPTAEVAAWRQVADVVFADSMSLTTLRGRREEGIPASDGAGFADPGVPSASGADSTPAMGSEPDDQGGNPSPALGGLALIGGGWWVANSAAEPRSRSQRLRNQARD